MAQINISTGIMISPVVDYTKVGTAGPVVPEFLLLETGDYLLLETGDKLELE